MNTDDLEISPGGGWELIPFEEILSRGILSIEYYNLPPSLSMRRLEDGIEIVWDRGILQSALTIKGPWKDVTFDETRRLFLRSSLPAEFFRVKPETK